MRNTQIHERRQGYIHDGSGEYTLDGANAFIALTASLRLGSLLFRWNAVYEVLAVLSLSLHADR